MTMSSKQKESMKILTKFIMSNAKLRKAYLESGKIQIRLGFDEEDYNDGLVDIYINENYSVTISFYDKSYLTFWDWTKGKGNSMQYYIFNKETYEITKA